MTYEIPYWTHITTEYNSKDMVLMPSTGPNICTTQNPSTKPSNMKEFHPYELLAYVPSIYPSKYTQQWFQVLYHSLQPSDIKYQIISEKPVENPTMTPSIVPCITSQYFISYTLNKFKYKHKIFTTSSSNISCWHFMF